MKTASRILGSASFAEGFEMQDAPGYGAERRGAPIFATVRAARAAIRERGPMLPPDLVTVADDSLVSSGGAGGGVSTATGRPWGSRRFESGKRGSPARTTIGETPASIAPCSASDGAQQGR
jgi:hypothetical protein